MFNSLHLQIQKVSDGNRLTVILSLCINTLSPVERADKALIESKFMIIKMRTLLVLLVSSVVSIMAYAEIKPAGIFTDGAVLQQGESVRIWGTAAPGEEVEVGFAGQRVTSKADADGKWMVSLEPMSTSTTPRELVVYSQGEKQTSIENVLVGEVWLAGGQSNMAGTMQNYSKSYQSEIDGADDKLLRFVTIPRLEFEGQNDLTPKWESATPNSVKGLSASAYFFAKNLRETLDVPVGIISCSVGATPAEAWMSRDTLAADPSLKRTLDAYDSHVQENVEDMDAYAKLHEKRSEEFQEWFHSRRNGTWDGEPRPNVPMGPHNYKRPAGLYETMLTQTIPYTITGVIWYQGENNTHGGQHYRTVFPALIESWRADFMNLSLPFLFVQLATMGPAHDTSGMWPELRDAQRWTTDNVDNTGMVVLVDGGEVKNIHPHSKDKVGYRLSLLARKAVYGEEDLLCQGPRLANVELKQNQIELSFTNIGDGLELKSVEMTPFEVCGEDGKYIAAEAELVGDKVIVSAEGVEQPRYVRYGWRKWFEPTLFNKDGLPASPFKTDTFEPESEGRYYLDRLDDAS